MTFMLGPSCLTLQRPEGHIGVPFDRNFNSILRMYLKKKKSYECREYICPTICYLPKKRRKQEFRQ